MWSEQTEERKAGTREVAVEEVKWSNSRQELKVEPTIKL